MHEHWHDPQATSEALHDDRWLRTGEAGAFDDDVECGKVEGDRLRRSLREAAAPVTHD